MKIIQILKIEVMSIGTLDTFPDFGRSTIG